MNAFPKQLAYYRFSLHTTEKVFFMADGDPSAKVAPFASLGNSTTRFYSSILVPLYDNIYLTIIQFFFLG